MSISTLSSSKPKRGLFWFRHDLRLHDQVALCELCTKVDELTLLYVIDDNWFKPNIYGLQPIGEHRFNFLIDTLKVLNAKVSVLGHSLLVLKGELAKTLVSLLGTGDYDYLGLTQCGGYNEQQQVEVLYRFFPNVEIIQKESGSLFNMDDLPFSVNTMPDVYTPFRQRIESAVSPREPIAALEALPHQYSPPVNDKQVFPLDNDLPAQQHEGTFTGGETAALDHLESYLFKWNRASTYKETRNGLENWRDSTKFSPWLALGALSPRYIMHELKKFEHMVVKNESTYWIYFELLWREFFYWQQQKHGRKWFSASGIKGIKPNTQHNKETFVSWCNGNTGYPIVDACMRQLSQTGFLSNRGRQIVASCLVNELRQDWRYGAAWFEQQLIDFDVASNWGNWMYLAGVGSDARPSRQFNLQRQTEQFDPTGSFCKKWLG